MTRQPIPSILDDVLSADVTDNSAAIRRSLRYDYSQISPLHRREVENAAVDILVSGHRMQTSVMAIGGRLLDVKRILDHGQFSDWCDTEFGMSQRTAQTWMNIARTFDGKSAEISLLSDSALALLAAPSTPEPARDAAITEAQQTGQSPTVARTKEIIAEHKPKHLYVNDLRDIVVAWAGANWTGEWPDNPSHTNGTFWQQLTTWMHQNLTGVWNETNLKAAIKTAAAQRQSTTSQTYACGLPTLNIPMPTTTPQSVQPASKAQESPTESNGYASQSHLEGLLKRISATPAELRDAAETHTGRVYDEMVHNAWIAYHYEVSPVTASAALRNTATVREHDDRVGRASRLIGIYNLAISTEDEYGELTGCYSETLAMRRELQLIARLERTCALLEGRPVEPMEACD